MASISQVVEMVNELRGEKKFSTQAHRRVSRILRAFRSSGECHEIAEDALGEAVLSFMERLGSMSPQQLASFNTINDVRAYLLRSVSNYALDRYRRWHGGASKTSSELQDSTMLLDPTKSTEMRKGARARYETDDLVTFLDSISYLDDNISFEMDLQRLDDLLHKRGISQDEIQIIKARLNGYSYQDLASKQGGTADKYRKIVKRAIERSGLEIEI